MRFVARNADDCTSNSMIDSEFGGGVWTRPLRVGLASRPIGGLASGGRALARTGPWVWPGRHAIASRVRLASDRPCCGCTARTRRPRCPRHADHLDCAASRDRWSRPVRDSRHSDRCPGRRWLAGTGRCGIGTGPGRSGSVGPRSAPRATPAHCAGNLLRRRCTRPLRRGSGWWLFLPKRRTAARRSG